MLSPTAAAELGVGVVPVPVALDGEPFSGPIDVFYERVRSGAVATTSQPSPAAFLDAYERAAANGATSVLSLHLDARVSGVSASAEAAARAASVRIVVADLPTVSYGVALCLRAACSALSSGASLSTAHRKALQVATALGNVFVARSAPGGRVSTPGSWTVLRFEEGVARPLAHHESVHRALEDLTRTIVDARPAAAAVGHAGRQIEPAADRLAHDLLRAGVGAVERYRVGPSVGAHTGPDCFGAFWLPGLA